MNQEFDKDPYPDRPKILFVGYPESSHTESWIGLLDDAKFNIRLFCLPSSEPRADWPVKSYLTVGARHYDNATRLTAYPPRRNSLLGVVHLLHQAYDRNMIPGPRIVRAAFRRLLGVAHRVFRAGYRTSIEGALAKAILDWKPDVIHTLGFDPASYLYSRTRENFHIEGIGRWVAQARGGPDLELQRYSDQFLTEMIEVFEKCDHFIADNEQNYAFALSAGLDPGKIRNPGMGVVSGAGGIDCDALEQMQVVAPSKRERVIVWPKAYETYTSKALPVFEAILKVWDRIQPCRIEMLWLVQSDVKIWYEKLFPEHIKKGCPFHGRLTREETLEKIAGARVMIAPSLSDGIPNTMMEAMALGAAPLVSPLDTIMPVVRDEENVLFARNLYPDEIAEALVRLMNDDDLVDRMAANNRVAIRKLADRTQVKHQALRFYEEVANPGIRNFTDGTGSAYAKAVFEIDDYPGRPRILIIGSGESAHTLSWLKMLEGTELNIRLFSPFVSEPPPDPSITIRSYVVNQEQPVNGPYRRFLHIPRGALSEPSLYKHVAQIIDTWHPNVIHTMGFFEAGRFFADARNEYQLQGKGQWLLQTRGGSDLELTRFQPKKAEKIGAAAAEADQILCDNTQNFVYLKAMGVDPDRFSRIGTVPGSGGLDLSKLRTWRVPPSERRTIIWPKAYNTAYTQALPVIEAIRLAWSRIQPCRIILLWVVQSDVEEWLATLPEELKACCEIHPKIAPEHVLERMGEARVMLAPSLVDGTPNSMFEAMLAGAIPIVSPLESIKSIVANEGRVLFARNLYPEEIAEALVMAFNDANLVTEVTEANLGYVAKVADRERNRERVVGLYESMAGV